MAQRDKAQRAFRQKWACRSFIAGSATFCILAAATPLVSCGDTVTISTQDRIESPGESIFETYRDSVVKQLAA